MYKRSIARKRLDNFYGDVDTAIDEYLKRANNLAYRTWESNVAPGSATFKLLGAKVINHKNEIGLNHLITNDVKIEFTYEILEDNQLFTHGFNLFNNHNVHILSSHDKDSPTLKIPLKKGVYTKTVVIPGNFLAEGGYNCSFAIMRYDPFHVEFHEMEVVGFTVIDEIGLNTVRGNYTGRFPGVVRPLLNWM